MSAPSSHEGEGGPAPAFAALAETHSAVVFFVGDRAFKMKKPVDLGFLDFTTVDARQLACEREVRLNRRLAPDVYLGVSSILDPDGEVCDHLVTMRRMPDDRRLSAFIGRGEQVDGALLDIAGQLSTLHAASAGPVPEGVASAAFVRSLWIDCFEVLSSRASLLDDEELARIEVLALRYLDGRSELFDERRRTGQVRDGHGDLQTSDIFVLDDGARILDCLEFDDELRWGDVVADVAFLAMDLERLGRPDLARRFLGDYGALTGRTWPGSLAHHYIAYRALVRAKVTALRSEQQATVLPELGALQSLCAAHLGRGRVRLVLVGGPPGTGKSTLAAALGRATGAVVLRSDEIRRNVHIDGDRYGAAAIDATYRQMLVDAERELVRGEHVILDASWSRDDHRRLARIAAGRCHADLIELRCDAPLDVAVERTAVRRRRGTDASEAGPEVALDMARRFEQWPQATTIDTDRSADGVLEDALSIWNGGGPVG